MCPGNASSTNIKLKMYIGDEELYSFNCPYNSSKAPVIYGGSVDESLYGKLKIEITGSSSVIIEAFAFNVI